MNKDDISVWTLCGAIAGIAIGIGLLVDKAACEARWEDSGRKYDWSLFASCRVEDKSGRLIPEKNIRDMQ